MTDQQYEQQQKSIETTVDGIRSERTSNIQFRGDGPNFRRHGSLLSLMGLSNPATGIEATAPGESISSVPQQLQRREIDRFFLEMSVSAYLAWRDIEERRGDILPHLPDIMNDPNNNNTCDFHWSLDMRDTQFSPRVGVTELLEATVRQQQGQDNEIGNTSSTTNVQAPFAVAGSLFSFVTKHTTTVASGLEIPQISGASTSMDLEGSPMFARTIPTNQEDARAAMAYYHHLGATRVAIVFVNEPYGIQYNLALQEEGQHLNITTLPFPVDLASQGGVDQSMKALKQSQAKYVFAALLDNSWREVFVSAYRQGVMGHTDYFWLTADMTSLLTDEFQLDRSSEQDLILAQAVHGLGTILLELESPSQDLFDNAFNNFVSSTTQQKEFIATITAEPELFDNNFTFPQHPDPYLYHYMVYDSVIALGLAACKTPGLFTGSELFEGLLQTEFNGTTGFVQFNPATGTRRSVTTRYRINNLLLSESRSTPSHARIDVIASTVVQGATIVIQTPFVYFDNTTHAPPALPPIQDYDYNLIPLEARITGLCIGGSVMACSVLLMIWVGRNRKTFIVSAAQPIFLVQLCVGTLVMASAVIALSMQGEESTPSLDAACMSVPWLLFLGFVLAISAILSKTWRLRELLDAAEAMRRVRISSLDAMQPFALLLAINASMLIACNVVSPVSYVRVDIANYDEFGRSTESYGKCESDNNWVYLFAGMSCFANFCAFSSAAYYCYKLRNVTAFFSETYYLSLSMGSQLETLLLGGPILLTVRDTNPTAFYLVASSLVSLCCLAYLVPVFIFKFGHQDANYGDAREDEQRQKRNKEQRARSGSGHLSMNSGVAENDGDDDDDGDSHARSHHNGLSSHRSGLSSHRNCRMAIHRSSAICSVPVSSKQLPKTQVNSSQAKSSYVP